MADQKATDTLVAQSQTITIGDERYSIATFCLAKTIRAFQLLTELGTSAGLQQVVAAADEAGVAGEFEQTVAPGFVSRALAVLPQALSAGVPALYRLLGLIVTPNRELADLEDSGADVDGYLHNRGMRIARTASLSETVELVLTGANALGVETIVSQLPNLRGLLGRS